MSAASGIVGMGPLNVIETATEGAARIAVVGNRCFRCMSSDRLSRGCELSSMIIAVGALATIILASLHVAPVSNETFLFCSVIMVLGGVCAYALHRNIELGGYEKQNADFAQQNNVLKLSIDRSRALTDEQAKNLDELRGQVGDFQRQNEILSKSIEEQARQLAELGGQVDHFRMENTRLETSLSKMERVQSVLQGTVQTLSTSAEASEAYIRKEEELQRVSEQLTIRQESLTKEEERLLAKLDQDVARVEAALAVKKERVSSLVLRVIPLSFTLVHLARILRYIKGQNPALLEDAKLEAKRLHQAEMARWSPI